MIKQWIRQSFLSTLSVLIFFGCIFTTSRLTAMMQDPEVRMNNVIQRQEIQTNNKNSLESNLQEENIWLNTHGPNFCNGQKLICNSGDQLGNCNLLTHQQKKNGLQNQVNQLNQDININNNTYLFMLNTRNGLMRLRNELFQGNQWIQNHGNLILINGNCSSPICNPQNQAFLPGMLQCQLPQHQQTIYNITNQITNLRNNIP